MNSKIKELTLSAIFLSLAGVLSIIQIPIVFGISLDFAFVAILIGRRYIGFSKIIIIGIIYPFFSLLGPAGSIPGVIFLILQILFLLFLDKIISRENESFFITIIKTFLIILLTTIFSAFINAVLIAPMFGAISSTETNESISFSTYYDNFWINAKPWIIIALIFNPFKLVIVYILYFALWNSLVKIKIVPEKEIT